MNIVIPAAIACVTACAAGQDLAQPGPFPAGVRTVTVTRPNTSTFSARLYYPALSAGANAPFDPTGGPYPAISFGHGFLQPVTRYESTLAHLATHGYVVIASESEGGLFPSHANFAADLRHCLTWLEQQHALPASFLFGSIDVGRFGLSGHSMGGGASILAAADDPRVDALANLAAAETNPSASAAMSRVRCPVALITGSADGIVAPTTNGVVMYNAGAAPKQIPIIQGGWHCGFQDVSSFGCDSGPMSRADQLALTRGQLTRFFHLYLKPGLASNAQTWRRVWGDGVDDDPRVQVTLASGIAVAAPAPAAVNAGKSVDVAFTITNASPTPTAFDLAPAAGPMPILGQPARTDFAGPGAAAGATYRASAPAGLAPGIYRPEGVVIRVADGGTRATVPIEVEVFCAADLDRDRAVDLADFFAFFDGYDGQLPIADLDDDGAVDLADFFGFFNAYDAGC